MGLCFFHNRSRNGSLAFLFIFRKMDNVFKFYYSAKSLAATRTSVWVLGTAVCDVTINRLRNQGYPRGPLKERTWNRFFSRILLAPPPTPYHSPLTTTVYTKIMSSFAHLRFQYFSLSPSFPSSFRWSAVYTTQHALFASS